MHQYSFHLPMHHQSLCKTSASIFISSTIMYVPMSRLFMSLSQTDTAEPNGKQARAVGDEGVEVAGDAA
jgi:hypothetical protein